MLPGHVAPALISGGGLVPALPLLEGGTRMRPCVAGSGGGVAAVVGGGVADFVGGGVAARCFAVAFAFFLWTGFFGGVAGFDASGGCACFAGVACFLLFDDESGSDARTMAATPL